MFKIVTSPTYTWPVTVDLPADGGWLTNLNAQIEELRAALREL